MTRLGSKRSGKEAEIADDASQEHHESKMAKLSDDDLTPIPSSVSQLGDLPSGPAKPTLAPLPSSMSQLSDRPNEAAKPALAPILSSMLDFGNRPSGAAKPTLANVLSSRFPILRRLVSRDLNLQDQATLLSVSQSLNVSINSVDHLGPFPQYFTGGRCDVMLPRAPVTGPDRYARAERCSYGADFRDDEFRPCSHDTSRSIVKLCEGSKVLKNSLCQRAVCSSCAIGVYEAADPGNYQNRVVNFGVTPICDSCGDNVPKTLDVLVDCRCTGPTPASDKKKDEDLYLCLECRIAYNLERFQAADDMARAYLYMEKNKYGVAEYDPGMKINHMKLPTCPCGNARYWTKCNFDRPRGMCVWCGAVKMPAIDGFKFPNFQSWYPPEAETSLFKYIKKQTLPSESTQHLVISAEELAALQRQIKEKGSPPPVSKGANKFWSYTNITDHPRILDANLRQEYEQDRRMRRTNRRKLKWDDHDGFLMNFRWPCIEKRRFQLKELLREAIRRRWEMERNRPRFSKGWRVPSPERTDYKWGWKLEEFFRFPRPGEDSDTLAWRQLKESDPEFKSVI